MSNIVGEGFPEEIVKQINVRQNKKGTFNRNTGGDPTLLVWQNSNTGWVKVVSSVDLTDERKNIFPAFAPAFLGGTGNLMVDRILDNYKGNVFKPGIL
jgi:hypothetical protein